MGGGGGIILLSGIGLVGDLKQDREGGKIFLVIPDGLRGTKTRADSLNVLASSYSRHK